MLDPTFTRSTSNKVSSNEYDASTSVLGQENSIESPFLHIYDRVGKPKSYRVLMFPLLTLLAITCFPIANSWLTRNVNIAPQSTEHVETHLGAVAADDTRCSEVGVSMLAKGGHAVDAAIATVLCAGVVNPTESSIGGGSFMIIHDASKSKTYAIDTRETAPAGAYEKMYGSDEVDFKGPRAMGVPGELRGLRKAWRMFGRLDWDVLFAPAIDYARKGFEVYPYLAQYAQHYRDEILDDPGLREILTVEGEILKEKEICYRDKLADTLEAIAAQGPKVFYKGWIGERLVEDISDGGGIMTMKDLENYKGKVREVMEVDFLGFKLVGMPPPSSGTIGLAMVSNILKNYGDIENVKAQLSGDLGTHKLIETLKHVLAARMNLGDPYDYRRGVAQAISIINSTAFGKSVWDKIKEDSILPVNAYDESSWKQLEDHGTSHQSVVDKDRNAVAITTSLNYHFGARFLSPRTGIIVNNQLGDFSFPKPGESGHPNRCRPNKRPLSSMTPLIIFKDDEFVGVVGGTGGRNIIAAVTQTLLRHFVLGRQPYFAVHEARVYPKVAETDVEYDDVEVYNKIPKEHIQLTQVTKAFLEGRGHKLEKAEYSAYCHFIVKNKDDDGTYDGTITAVSDIRKGARPAAEQPAPTPAPTPAPAPAPAPLSALSSVTSSKGSLANE